MQNRCRGASLPDCVASERPKVPVARRPLRPVSAYVALHLVEKSHFPGLKAQDLLLENLPGSRIFLSICRPYACLIELEVDRERAILIPRREVKLTRDNDERRQPPSLGTDALDHCNPFPVSGLSQFRVRAPFRACDDHTRRDHSHHKASLVKVVDIGHLDAIFGDCVLHKDKPATNDLWIFAFGSPVVISPKTTRL
ncbi:Acyl-coenzyme A oxidase 1 [Fusarium oxysporum f. sp. albedinis]|nr:Acyl-coenzyme A oxidase 1 [Fusarium oxysporum f. sp. albedinis]